MEKRKFHISIVLIPDAMTSNLGSIFEVLRTMSRLNTFDESIFATPLFDVEFVASSHADIEMAGGLTLKAHRAIADIEQTDIIIVPSVMVEPQKWHTGRFTEVVEWLSAMHARGAVLCSACSGVLLLAETGLLDGKEATMHWCYASTFHQIELCLSQFPFKLNKRLLWAVFVWCRSSSKLISFLGVADLSNDVHNNTVRSY